MVNNICMRIKLTLLLVIVAASYASAQHRVNLNNWFLAANIGTTTGHMDVRPAGGSEYLNLSQHFGYILSPEVSYHFTHGFGVVASWSWANVRSNEASKVEDGKYYREYNTNLNELKVMGHLNLGKALSFNKRKNIVSPYINAGAGSTWGRLKAPLSKIPGDWAGNYLEIDRLHNNRESDSANFQTWNKNIQLGFYWYLTRYIDLDIRYNYTFYNEDYIDGSWLPIFANREWDKYSSLSVGARFKFGSNNRRTYEHTSWAREPMEEDTSLFNNYVEIEEFDDGQGNPVFKIRNRPDNINQEELTQINTDNAVSDDDVYQAVYNTLMDNPEFRDSVMAALAKDLQDNDAFITKVKDGVCVECENGQKVVYRGGEERNINYNDDDKTVTVVRTEDPDKGSSSTGTRRGDDPEKGVGDRQKIINPPTNLGEFELRDIYYDLDEAFIRDDASSSLDELATLLKKYPNLKIELGSHTDCRNSKDYNLALSQRRALAAVNYLECQGIDRCRLVAKAYGESQLVNKCECEGEVTGENCTDSEHQENRRTTVKILDYNYQKGQGGCQEGVDVDANAQDDANKNSIAITPDASITELQITNSQVTGAGVSMSPAAGYYIVIGTSYHPAYAMSLAGVAKDKEDFNNANVLYLDNSKYFVYADSSTSYEDALAKLKAVRCCTRFPDAWIYGYNMAIPK